jgi:hypothetical protein
VAGGRWLDDEAGSKILLTGPGWRIASARGTFGNGEAQTVWVSPPPLCEGPLACAREASR